MQSQNFTKVFMFAFLNIRSVFVTLAKIYDGALLRKELRTFGH